MSLVGIKKSEDIVVIITDSRATDDRVTSPTPRVQVRVVWCFDFVQKSYVLNVPHNHFAFSAHGTDIIDVASLLSDFEAQLPNERLSIIDYANRLKDFFGDRIPAEQDGDLEFNVIGYDDATARRVPLHFGFKLPSAPQLIPVEERFFIDGDLDPNLVTNLFDRFSEKVLKALLARKRNKKITSEERELLRALKGGNRLKIKDLLNTSLAADFCKEIVIATSVERRKKGRPETVGGDLNIIRMDPVEGAVWDSPNVSNNPQISKKAYSFIEIKCCQTQRVFLDLDRPAPHGFLGFPREMTFICERCKTELNLNEFKDRLIAGV